MAIRRIAVLGAGNGGCAAAADLTLRGYDVRLFSRSATTLDPILKREGIALFEDSRELLAKPHLVTTDLREAVEHADLVMITAPSTAHEYFGRALVSCIQEDQRIFLNPGHTCGALHLAHVLRESGLRFRPMICETVTLTYICRLKGPARVEIYRRTSHLRCAPFPAKAETDMVSEIQALYPNVIAAENVLETGLSNINALMHPAGMVANAGWIEKSTGDFYFYGDGITPSVGRVIGAVDRERLRIVKKLRLPPLSFVEIFYQAGLTSRAAMKSRSIYQAIQESAPNRTIRSPEKLDHRYLREDVGYGLVPMRSLGRLVNQPTPVIDALITLASALNDTNYLKEGLTLEKMGLAGLDVAGVKAVLDNGF